MNNKQRQTLKAIFTVPVRSDIKWTNIESLFKALGKVLDIKDVITFKGKTVSELEQEFHNSVDDYLEWCDELGEEPDKPFSGKLPFRTTPENHRKIYLAAKKANKSINAWMDDTLAKKVRKYIEN